MVAVIKRLYLANGHLATPLDAYADDIAVDTSVAGALQGLEIGDHCYLTLVEDDKLEVVQIRKDYSGFSIRRAQDGTIRQSFSLRANILYKLTAAEIVDAVVSSPYNIYASGYGFAEVTHLAGVWNISIPAIQAVTLGGVDSRTEGNTLVLSDKVGMFGCCDGGVTGAPSILGPFFYLTSKLYPYEAVEVVSNNPKDKNGNVIPPIDFDLPWWLLTQPSVVEPNYIRPDAAPFEWELFGGAKVFTVVEPQYVSQNMGVMDWEMFGGAEQFTSVEPTYIAMDGYILEMLMFGSAVVYDRAVDAYVLQKFQVLDWTLE